jgi:hypothetical protein
MSFGLRSIFTAPTVDLGSQAVALGLSRPTTLRAVAANAAIPARYQALGGYQGQLGVATSVITPSTDGLSYTQGYRGGNLHFTDNGGVCLSDGLALTILYQGIHCFGNPGFGKSDTVYGILSWFNPEQGNAKTIKVPNDGTGDAYDDLEQYQDRTFGATALISGSLLTPPQPTVLTATIIRCSDIGCNSEQMKSDIANAVAQVKDAYGEYRNVPVWGAAFVSIVNAIVNAIGSLLGGLVNDVPIGFYTFSFPTPQDFVNLGPVDSHTQGPIKYNLESGLISDGDASYKMYFDVELFKVQDQNPLCSGV